MPLFLATVFTQCKKPNTQLTLEFVKRYTERRLPDLEAPASPAKIFQLSEGVFVLKLGECHVNNLWAVRNNSQIRLYGKH